MRCCTPWASEPVRPIFRSPPRTPRTCNRSCSPPSRWLLVRVPRHRARVRWERSVRSTGPCSCTVRRRSRCIARFRWKPRRPHRTRSSRCTTRARPRWSSPKPKSSSSRVNRSGPRVHRCSFAVKVDGAAIGARRVRRTSRPTASPIMKSRCRRRPTRRSCTACRAIAIRCTPIPRSPRSVVSIGRFCTDCAPTVSPVAHSSAHCATTTSPSSSTSKVVSRRRSYRATL